MILYQKASEIKMNRYIVIIIDDWKKHSKIKDLFQIKHLN